LLHYWEVVDLVPSIFGSRKGYGLPASLLMRTN
jgi:hypothetical protein